MNKCDNSLAPIYGLTEKMQRLAEDVRCGELTPDEATAELSAYIGDVGWRRFRKLDGPTPR